MHYIILRNQGPLHNQAQAPRTASCLGMPQGPLGLALAGLSPRWRDVMPSWPGALGQMVLRSLAPSGEPLGAVPGCLDRRSARISATEAPIA